MGMVVRTNTMALNAYRQLGMNNSAVTKSLEKLSSGFRINRAGDDAAGLAISEKMKAQITGLETASANAQDGISLIQTAEGNLSEVHDMLNRMVELASKSANGTYTTTERQALQDEVDQLLDEIDRISQSANFNGTKLLDGSLDGVGTTVANKSTITGLSNFENYQTRFGKNPNPQVVDGIDWGKEATVHKDPTASGRTSFEFRLNGRELEVATAGDLKLGFGLTSVDDTNAAKDAGSVDLEFTGLAAGDKITGEDVAKKFVETTGGTIDLVVGTDKDGADVTIKYKVTNDGSTLKFEMADEGYAAAVGAGKELSPFRGNFLAGFGIDTGNSTATASKVSMADVSTSNIVVGSPNSGGQLAETIAWFGTGENIKDGAGVMIGEEYYVWGGSDETVDATYGDGVKVIDVRDLMENGALKADDAGTGVYDDKMPGKIINEALSRLTEAAAGNRMFDVQLNKEGDGIAITEKITNSSDIDLTTEQNVKDQLKFFTSAIKKSGGNGKALTLQIGDTADLYNKMSVNVADMSTTGLALKDLSIMTEESASNAIDTIKTAINSVSTARAGMGALQNRLEHTINNLDVAVENLSAANSRIRDTDMAKEMMNYTKMNVLVQSAQAMLAQANQQPQSVLQLLQ